MINVIKGPVALSYKGINGRTYWFGVSSGNRTCDKLHCTAKKAIEDAEKECTERVDVNPDKVLRPIGFTFREWCEHGYSTETPGWIYWKIIGFVQTFKYRMGDTIYYERMEEIEGIEESEWSGE